MQDAAMRSIPCRSLALAIGLALAACQSPSSDAGTDTPPVAETAPTQQRAVASTPSATPATQAVIRGRAMYAEKIKMPPGGYLVLQLIDSQLADTPKAVIAQTRLDDVAGSPFDFSLSYDPSKLRPQGLYGLHASLYGPEGALLFVTDTRVPFTTGQGDVGEFRMKMLGNAAADAPSSQASVWEQAKARGVEFRGLGTEPGWSVEVDRGDSPELRAELDYGERRLLVPHAQQTGSPPGFAGKTADGTEVLLRIEKKSCSDGMSDATYPAEITLAVGDATYSGCGRYLDE
jgi:uncharacterized lipoprotein YbaY